MEARTNNPSFVFYQRSFVQGLGESQVLCLGGGGKLETQGNTQEKEHVCRCNDWKVNVHSTITYTARRRTMDKQSVPWADSGAVFRLKKE